jgi:hypothetical protein
MGAGDCERLCDEADMLLNKSLIYEEDNVDLNTAMVLCQAASQKARAAMDAPYNNSHSMNIAIMKHSTCVMRLKSLHKRMASQESLVDLDIDGRHSRSGQREGRHSRQNSRDSKGSNHSRQNSRELLQFGPEHVRQSSRELMPPPPAPALAGVETSIELYATLPKKTRISREEVKTEKSKREKRARSEERKRVDVPEPEPENLYRTLSSASIKVPEEETKKSKNKQHKIRRKLLMGGLIKRKNRSLPDLRDDEQQQAPPVPRPTTPQQQHSNGYLSEGSTNLSLEKSKFMRKSSSRNTLPAKVPPPPPLRTSSQLTKGATGKPPLPEPVVYSNLPALQASIQSHHARNNIPPPVAAKHREPVSMGEDCVDSSLPLPPYPSPPTSVVHSRQGSEDFPPPPPNVMQGDDDIPDSFLERLQVKRAEMLRQHQLQQQQRDPTPPPPQQVQSEPWLKELLVMQAARRQSMDCSQKQISVKMEELRLQQPDLRVQALEECRKKKKSVTFCDEVTLVATADDNETDSFIPNPILERVLRSAIQGGPESTYQRLSVNDKPPTPLMEHRTYQERPQGAYQPVPAQTQNPPYQQMPQKQPQQMQQQPIYQQHNPSPYQPIPYQQQKHHSPSPTQHLSSTPPTNNPYPYQQVPYHQQQQAAAPQVQSSPSPYQHVPTSQISYQPPSNPSPYMPIPNNNNSNPYNNKGSAASTPIMESRLPHPHQVMEKPPTPTLSSSPYHHMMEKPPTPTMMQPYQTLQRAPTPDKQQPQAYLPAQKVYQRVPPPYQRVPEYQKPPTYPPQQRLPPYYVPCNNNAPNGAGTNMNPSSGVMPPPQNKDYPPYQHPPAPNGSAVNNKRPPVSGTTSAASGPQRPCNLCRKKGVNPPAVYCVDCDCYMSRFRPKT